MAKVRGFAKPYAGAAGRIVEMDIRLLCERAGFFNSLLGLSQGGINKLTRGSMILHSLFYYRSMKPVVFMMLSR
jgi:hypothetical protein